MKKDLKSYHLRDPIFLRHAKRSHKFLLGLNIS